MSKVVYLAHPYGGKDGNYDIVYDLINDLIFDFEGDYIFITPILLWGQAYKLIDYVDGVDMCLDLLDRCDELWLAGNWRESCGCMAEYAHARAKLKTIKTIDSKGMIDEVLQ